MGRKPKNINIYDGSVYEYIKEMNKDNDDCVAIRYFKRKMSFKTFFKQVDECASAFKSTGIREGDVVAICMANTPEAVIAFYALSKIGAIANMIHPLSAEAEIKDSLNKTHSVMLIAINVIYDKIKDIVDESPVFKTVIVSPSDSMPKLLKTLYNIKVDKIKYSKDESIVRWNDFMNTARRYNARTVHKTKDDVVAIFHSGGTTGVPKNIELTNGNMNALGEQAHIVLPDMRTNDNFLTIMPMFHCFGLVVSVHCPLSCGTSITLVPKFDAKRFDKLITDYKPTVMAGVPTLFEAMMTNKRMDKVDMSRLKIVLSGGDSLTASKNKKVNDFLKDHGCKAKITQGYGMTETCGPVTFGTDLGSIGVAFPGNKLKIINPYTKEEVEQGETGEILIAGPTVMKDYLNNEEETNNTIEVDAEGIRWVHTGDLGHINKEGNLYFDQRLKRMLIVSGYNVYPSHIEEVLLQHPYIETCGVVGIPHPYKVQVPKAFLVLKSNVKLTNKVKKEIQDYCEKNLAHYMIPKEFVYRESLPKTMVGKVNYRELEKESV